MNKTELETALSPSLMQELVLFLTNPENTLMAQGMISQTKRNYVNKHHPRKISQMHSSDKYRNGKWSTYVYVDGKRRMVEKQTEEDIYNYLFDFYKAQEEGPKTFQDVFDLLMKDKLRNNLTDRTVYENTRSFNQIYEKIRNKPIIEVTEEELRDWLIEDFLPTTPTREGLKKVIQIINQTFRYGQQKHICRDNPANFILYKQYANRCVSSRKRNEEKSFTPEEEEKLRQYALNHIRSPHAVCMLISMETGMRAGELAYLKKTDVTEDGFLHVHGQQVRIENTNGKTCFHKDVDYTKNEVHNPRNGRYIPILFDCQEALSFADQLPGDSVYVLHHPDGRPIQKGSYMTYLRRVCKKLGITITNNHAFRMGFNIKLIEVGISEVDRCYILGHSMETNLKHYSNSDERHRNTIKELMQNNFPRRKR